jgi:hypothetical protein
MVLLELLVDVSYDLGSLAVAAEDDKGAVLARVDLSVDVNVQPCLARVHRIVVPSWQVHEGSSEGETALRRVVHPPSIEKVWIAVGLTVWSEDLVAQSISDIRLPPVSGSNGREHLHLGAILCAMSARRYCECCAYRREQSGDESGTRCARSEIGKMSH